MILASKSPRRKEILENFGFKLSVVSPDIEEISDEKDIYEQIKDIANKKCIKVALANKEEYVLAADTVVIVDGILYGKPKDEEEAEAMLKKLSGRGHEVMTAYSFTNIDKGVALEGYDITKVFFKKLSEEEIKWYLSTKEPLDKAGAYGVQGKGSVFIERIEGDFYNVMGFPVSKFYNDIKDVFKIEDIAKI